MAESSVRPSAGGVARRRRERRLRSWWRHEQQTVRMALAAATHHSAQQNAAPRGPKIGARAREVEEQATHDGLRAQTAPPPGARPGILAEPGPQRSDRSLRHSSGGAPSLALVSLAGGDTPDDATVAFLLSAALALKKEEEEEERRKREEELKADEKKKLEARERKRAKALKGWDEEALWQLNRRVQAGSTLSSAEYAAWYYWDASSSSSKRKRKKKRKKKLPKAAVRSSSGSSSSFVPAGFTGYAAPRAVFFVVVRPRCFASWPVWNSLTVTQWAGFACHDAPRAVFPSILLVQQTVEVPLVQFICVVIVLPVVTLIRFLMVQTARRTIEIPQLLVYKVVNVPVMRDVLVPRVRRGEDSCSHSCSSMSKAFLLCVVMSLVCRPFRSCRFPRRGVWQFMVQTRSSDHGHSSVDVLLCGCAAPWCRSLLCCESVCVELSVVVVSPGGAFDSVWAV